MSSEHPAQVTVGKLVPKEELNRDVGTIVVALLLVTCKDLRPNSMNVAYKMLQPELQRRTFVLQGALHDKHGTLDRVEPSPVSRTVNTAWL